MKRISLAAVVCTLFLGACAHHPAQMGVDANYQLSVTNNTAAPVSVSLNMGADQMSALGQVDAGQTRMFEVRNPSTSEVKIIYSDVNGQNPHSEKIQLSRSRPATMIIK